MYILSEELLIFINKLQSQSSQTHIIIRIGYIYNLVLVHYYIVIH